MKPVTGVMDPSRSSLYDRPQVARSWLRPLLILGLLLVSSSLTFVASTKQGTLVLALFSGAALILISLLRPPVGLIAAALGGLVVPYVGPSGLNVTLIMVAVLLGLWLLQLMVSRGQPRRALSHPVRALVVFVVVAVLALGVGQLPWLIFARHAPLGAQLGGLAIVILSAGAFLLAAYQVHELRWLSRMTWAFLAVATLSVMARSVLPQFGLSTQDWFQPVGSVFLICLVALGFSQAAYNRDLHPGWRWVLGGIVLVTLSVQVFLRFGSKSAWIPALSSVVAILAFRSWRSALVLVPIAALSAWYLAPSVILTDAYSVSTRFEAWSILAQIIKISPILGLGFANYYWYTPLYPIQGYSVSFNSHNNYVDIVAQTGLIGLACFAWFLWEVGRLGWRLRKRAPAGFARSYVYGALGALVGMVVAMMLGDWVLPFFYNVGLLGFRSSMLGWLFLGGLVSLDRMGFAAAAERELPKVTPAEPGAVMDGRG